MLDRKNPANFYYQRNLHNSGYMELSAQLSPPVVSRLSELERNREKAYENL